MYIARRAMSDKGEPTSNNAKRSEKLHEEEAKQLIKEQGRKKIYLAREQQAESARGIAKAKRLKNRAADESEELARERARKEAYLAKEKKMAEAEEARKLKDKNPPPK